MVGGLASRFRALQVTLNAVIARAADVDCAALHEEELLAVDTVAYGRSHVDGGILDGKVLSSLDAVFHVAHDVECTLLGKLGVSLNVEAALLCAAGSIDECVGGAGYHLYLDALAVLYVNGCTAINGRRVGQRQAV